MSYEVSGSGFSDNNADGRADVGTVNSITVYSNGALLFTISGIGRSIADLYSVPGGSLLNNILGGDDAINGSSDADDLWLFGGSDTIHAGAGNDVVSDYQGGVASGETQLGCLKLSY